MLFIVGILMGGHLDHMSIAGVVLILYLAMVSAVAYTLWSVLLAHNEVSKVAIFGFVNPLCSVVLSALVLGEVSQAFNARSLIALILVCVGIYIVNCKSKIKEAEKVVNVNFFRFLFYNFPSGILLIIVL